jgi:hypothetical protein
MGDDEDIEEFFTDEGDEPPAPTYRLTIRTGRVMLTDWAPWLAHAGPMTNLLRERGEAGVAIADLTHLGEDGTEIAARFYADGGDRAGAERALLRWARRRLPARLAPGSPRGAGALPGGARDRAGPVPVLRRRLAQLEPRVLARRPRAPRVPEVVRRLRLRAAPVVAATDRRRARARFVRPRLARRLEPGPCIA